MTKDEKRIINWIDYKLKAWGLAKYKLMTAEEAYPQSIMARIRDYGSATFEQTGLERFREGMTGDALECSLAIYRAMMCRNSNQRLTDRQYEVVFVHYACRGYSVEHKVSCLDYSGPGPYYQCLARAHHKLECFFDAPVNNSPV